MTRTRAVCLAAIAVSMIALESPSTQASTITVYTRPIVATANSSAQDYLNNWNAALAANPIAPAGYGEAVILTFRNIQTHTAIDGGSNTNISVFYNVDFYIPLTTGTKQWRFRFTTDFGLGGAVFLDGKAVAFSNANLDGSIYLQFTRFLKPGTHNIQVYGQEDCCDGFSDGQVRPPGGPPLINRGVGNLSLTDGWNLK